MDSYRITIEQRDDNQNQNEYDRWKEIYQQIVILKDDNVLKEIVNLLNKPSKLNK